MLKDVIKQFQEMPIEELTKLLKSEGVEFVPKSFLLSGTYEGTKYNFINTQIHSKVAYGSVRLKFDFDKISKFIMTEFETNKEFEFDSEYDYECENGAA